MSKLWMCHDKEVLLIVVCIALHTVLVMLTYKDDPCLCAFNQSETRLSLVTCLEKERFTQFSILIRLTNTI